MLLRVKIWYKRLTPLAQLSIAFLATWIICFAFYLLGDKVFFETNHSLADRIFNATFSAIFMTLVAWNKIKAVAKKNRNIGEQEGLEKQF